MTRLKEYNIHLTKKEVKKLKSAIHNKKVLKSIHCTYQIILDLDETHGKALIHEQSVRSNSICIATVTNTVAKYIDDGIDTITNYREFIMIPYILFTE